MACPLLFLNRGYAFAPSYYVSLHQHHCTSTWTTWFNFPSIGPGAIFFIRLV